MQVEIQLRLLKEIKRVLEQSGIRSLINYLWLTIKHLGRNPPTAANNLKKYDKCRRLNDVNLLKEIQQNLWHTLNIYPRESFKFHRNETFTFLRYFWNSKYFTDKTRREINYLSDTMKQDAIFRYKTYGNSIVIDKSEESNFTKPSYFVIKEGTQYTIVVRGTANSEDQTLDIDITPTILDDFLVHQGFYRHALEIYNELDFRQLLSDSYSYVTTGYSMGGAVSCLLAYLIYTNVTKSVKSFGFASGCVGNMQFVRFTQQFTITLVQGYDFIPQMTMHGFYCQCERLLYENQKSFYKGERKQKLAQIIQNNAQYVRSGALKIQKYRSDLTKQKIDLDQMQIFELFQDQPFSKDISENVETEYDMFVGGDLYHCIHGEIYQINIHDYSEFFPSPVGFLDHYGYPWLYDELTRLINLYEKNQ